MKQLGMKQESVDAIEVIVRTPDKELIFTQPDLQQITMQGQTTFQLSGDFTTKERAAEITISDDDVSLVATEAKVSNEEAKAALEKNNGDIAEAIVSLS